MASIQEGFQSLWLFVLLPIGAVVFAFTAFSNHMKAAVWTIIGVALCGGLVYFPADAAVTMANGAGRLLAAVVNAFVPA